MESAGCALSRLHLCESTSFNTCVPHELLISLSRSQEWRGAPSNDMHLPNWRLFCRCHVGRVVSRDTLSQCWPRSMMPPGGCLTLRGCERYDKSPSPKIDSLLAFHPPIALPSNSAIHIVSSGHSFTTCLSNLSPKGRPMQSRSDPAWAP
jgi:hypothetical protein